jgi:hypothetical protein
MERPSGWELNGMGLMSASEVRTSLFVLLNESNLGFNVSSRPLTGFITELIEENDVASFSVCWTFDRIGTLPSREM